MSAPLDVLIAGAGPAGSASAIWLARAGFRVALVDRAAFPRDKPCSEYMGPETLRLLDGLGVLSDVESAGRPLAGTEVLAPCGSRLAGRFAHAGHQPFRPTGLSLARKILDARLVQAARDAGAEVLERVALESLLYEHGAVAGAVLRESGGQRRVLRARLTLGADGLRSVVARRLGYRRHGRPRRVAFVAHVADVAGMGASAEMHVGAQGYLGLNAIGGGLTNVALVVPAARARAARGRATEFFHQTIGEFPGVSGRIDRRRLAREVLVTGPFAARSRRVVVDGALLVGDAADFFDPFTGEGIYRALRGAELVAEAAIPALAATSVARPIGADRLAPYVTARRRAFAGRWVVERLIGYAMWFPALFDRAVARLARRGMAHTLIGVTGDFVPAREVLNPLFLARMVL